MTNKTFRTWDSITLQETVKHAIQIKAKINQICIEHDATPQQLPHSLVPTDHLYDLAVCFEAMYDKLIEYDLVKTGNLKFNRNNIH